MNSMKLQKTPSIAGLALVAGIALGAGVQGVATAADGSVYYNNGGVQGEATGLVWDDVNNRVDLKGNKFTLNSGDTTVSSLGGFGPRLATAEAGRMDIGFGATLGANVELYSKGHASSPGQFKMIYGGSAGLGKFTWTHYNGSAWTNNMALDASGNLYVRGTVNATEVLVQSSFTWPDYVFEENYPLMPLEQLDGYIRTNGHLPGVPTQEMVKGQGVNVGEMSAQLLRKVEELTLYVIDLKKENQELSAKVSQLEGSKAD